MASLALIGLIGLGGFVSVQSQRSAPAFSAPVLALPPTQALPAISKPRPAAAAAVSPAQAFVLSGIMEQNGEKVAVVNDTIVQAGDLVDGARVLEVRSDSVWLRARNQDVILKTGR